MSEAATRFTPIEVWEAKNPWLLERVELAPGLVRARPRTAAASASTCSFRVLEDAWLTSAVERTKNAPWGLEGGGAARPNRARCGCPTARARASGRRPRLLVPKGATLELYNGGGGGYGPPPSATRRPCAPTCARATSREEYARRHYPHAFE